MLGSGLFLQNTLAGVVFLPGDEKNAFLCPYPKELVIDIPSIERHNRAGRKCHRLGNIHFMGLSIGDMGKYRQISVMVQEQMEFHRTLGLTELGPVKQAGA